MTIRKILIAVFVALSFVVGYAVLIRPQYAEITVAKLYRCPMHPQVTSDHPGDCLICGMHLVEVAPHAEHDVVVAAASATPTMAAEMEMPVPGYSALKISPQDRVVMGINLEEVKRGPLERPINAVGRVAFDETKLHHLHTKFEGYIDEIFIDFVGQQVKAGDPLFSIYSPDVYATENEYVLALKGQGRSEGSFGNTLADSAKKRLDLWGVSPEEIERLEKTLKPSKAVVMRSPINGFVTAKSALQGMRVTPSDTIYDIADLSSVWVIADIYEADIPFVKVGQNAEVTLAASPGKSWKTAIGYIYPSLDEQTRTVKVRLILDNPSAELKPEMYANVLLQGSLGEALIVPESAVLWTGERTIVFVETESGSYVPREVETGVKVRNFYEIRKGLSAGERVATGANFLLDSESKLKASAMGEMHTHTQP